MFRAARTQPSRLLAQTVPVIAPGHQDLWPRCPSTLPATDCAVTPASRVLSLCFYSEVSASSRGPLYPASTSVPRSQGEPFRLRPRRPSATPSRRSLPLFQGAQGLPSTALQSPPPLSLPDRLRGHAPLRSAPYGTGRLTEAPHGHRHIQSLCETASTIGQPGTPASASSRKGPSSPAQPPGKRNKYIDKEAAADAAAGAVDIASNRAQHTENKFVNLAKNDYLVY